MLPPTQISMLCTGWVGWHAKFVERISFHDTQVGCSGSSSRNGHLIVVVRHPACIWWQ